MLGNYLLAIVIGAAIGIYAGKDYQYKRDYNTINRFQVMQCTKADKQPLTTPGS